MLKRGMESKKSSATNVGGKSPIITVRKADDVFQTDSNSREQGKGSDLERVKLPRTYRDPFRGIVFCVISCCVRVRVSHPIYYVRQSTLFSYHTCEEVCERMGRVTLAEGQHRSYFYFFPHRMGTVRDDGMSCCGERRKKAERESGRNTLRE